MKNILLVCLLFFAGFVYGQDNTNVSATVTDSDNISWSNGSWSAQLYNPRGGTVNYISTGQPVQTSFSGTLDGTGSFTQIMPNNLALAPAGTGWQFNICPFASSSCSLTTPLTITGSSQNLSSILTTQIKPPRFPALGTGYYGYSDVEINTTPNPGGSYFNVVSSGVRFWDPTTSTFSEFSTGANTCLLTGCTFSGGPDEFLYQTVRTPNNQNIITGRFSEWFWSGIIPNSFTNGQINHTYDNEAFIDSTPGCWGFQGTCYNTQHTFTNLLMYVNGGGGTNVHFNNSVFFSVGDHIGSENYVTSYGGSSDGGGPEGTKGESNFVGENNNTWTGNNTNGGVGQTQIVATCLTECGTSPWGYPFAEGLPAGVGQGMTITDTQATVASGQITATTNSPGGDNPGTMTVNITSGLSNLAVSTCEATLNSSLLPLQNPVGTGFQTLTFTVTLVSGTCVAGQLVNFEGTNHEQAIITSVTAPSGGQQNITMNVRMAHNSGSYIFENPNSDAGLFADIVANHNSLPYPVEILGVQSISSSTAVLWWRYWYGGTTADFISFPFGNMILGSVGAGSFTNTAGVVSMQIFGGAREPYFNNTTIFISGSSNPAFNGVCTSTSYTNINTNPAVLTCTQAASTGQTSAGGSISLTDPTLDNPNGNSRVNFYQGAAILDPQDEANPIVVNGKNQFPVDGLQFTVEPNKMPLGAGDSLIEQHGTPQFHNYEGTLSQDDPVCYTCNLFTLRQTGVYGNTGAQQNYAALSATNNTGLTHYSYFGGTRIPTSFIFLQGLWGNVIDMFAPPAPGFSVINSVGCPQTGIACDDPNYEYGLYNFIGFGGILNNAQYFPFTNIMQINGPWQFNTAPSFPANTTIGTATFTPTNLQLPNTITNGITFGTNNIAAAYVFSSNNYFAGSVAGDQVYRSPSGSALLFGDATSEAMSILNGNLCLGASRICTNPIKPNFSGTSGSIGGGALTAGACATGTVSITGATTSMVASVSGAGSDPGGNYIVRGYVSAANVVTVQVCAVIAGTPAAQTYNVRVTQ